MKRNLAILVVVSIALGFISGYHYGKHVAYSEVNAVLNTILAQLVN